MVLDRSIWLECLLVEDVVWRRTYSAYEDGRRYPVLELDIEWKRRIGVVKSTTFITTSRDDHVPEKKLGLYLYDLATTDSFRERFTLPYCCPQLPCCFCLSTIHSCLIFNPLNFFRA